MRPVLASCWRPWAPEGLCRCSGSGAYSHVFSHFLSTKVIAPLSGRHCRIPPSLALWLSGSDCVCCVCVWFHVFECLHRRTGGSASAALPPSRTEMIKAFDTLHRPDVSGCALTVGARALAKHAYRGAGGHWALAAGGNNGGLTGGDRQKSLRAKAALNSLLSNAAWANTHALPGDVRFERQLFT